MQDYFLTVLVTLTGTGIAATVLAWLLGKWVGARIDSSIKAEYDRLKLQEEIDQRRREKAQLVAELLAEWMSTPLDGAMSPEQRKQINRLSFEATLWLPEEIAIDLSKVLQHDPSAGNQFDLLLRVRSILSGQHNLTVRHVTQWARDRELPNRGLPQGFTNGQITVLNARLEISGESTDIQFANSLSPFVVPEGARTLLAFPKEGKTCSVATTDIRALRMIKQTVIDNKITELTLEVFPKDIANQINISLYGQLGTTSGEA